MSDLTKAQRRWFTDFQHGWTISDPTRVPAPLRRLLQRKLIEKTGVMQGRPYFQASAAGRAALEKTP